MFKRSALVLLLVTGVLLAESKRTLSLHAASDTDRKYITVDASRDRILPVVIFGDGWKTRFFTTNLDTAPVEFDLYFYNADGGELTVPIAELDGKRVSALHGSIPRHGSLNFETSDIVGATESGWAEIVVWVPTERDRQGQLGGAVTFRKRIEGIPDVEASLPFARITDTRLAIPFDNRAGFNTLLFFVNPDVPEAPTARLSLTFRDEEGNILRTDTVPIAPLHQTFFQVSEAYPELQGRAGTLQVVSSGRNLSSFGLRLNPNGPFSIVLPFSVDSAPEAPHLRRHHQAPCRGSQLRVPHWRVA